MIVSSVIQKLAPDIQDDSREWMRFLMGIGASLAAANISKPITAAVCLPRVEFSGLLIASGICLHSGFAAAEGNSQQSWQDLVGKPVSFTCCSKNPVRWQGVLLAPETDQPTCLKIQTPTGPYPLEPDHWGSIRLDTENNKHRRFPYKAALDDEHSNALLGFLPTDVVHAICYLGIQTTLVAPKNRIAQEMKETLTFINNPTGACAFRDLLRPEEDVPDSPVTRVMLAKHLTSLTARGIVIIEGSRCLVKDMSASSDHHRVILLGRNEPGYSDYVDVVAKCSQQRISNVERKGDPCPTHIILMMFHH
jgi:hypothetical protein